MLRFTMVFVRCAFLAAVLTAVAISLPGSRSGDAAFSFGLWRRVPESGPMAPPYHEIAVIIEGEVEVTEEDGTVHHIGAGDVLITPRGSKATWKALSAVKKFWAVYKE